MNNPIETLLVRLHHLDNKKRQHYKKWQKYKQEYEDLQKKISKHCKHFWQPDINRAGQECRTCGSHRG